MKFHLNSLRLALKGGDQSIAFDDVTYFWGQMGAGKTSVARLIDYCLGADINLTPALQNEFVAATLDLTLKRGNLVLERGRDSDQVIVVGEADAAFGPFQLSIPARDSAGPVIPQTEVEVLSDLIFWMSGIIPPRVRRSKKARDSPRERLSIRDLLWYCYLDQDEMDSTFFSLEDEAVFYKRLKSRDVLRFVIGFHDEHIAEIEAALDQLRASASRDHQ